MEYGVLYATSDRSSSLIVGKVEIGKLDIPDRLLETGQICNENDLPLPPDVAADVELLQTGKRIALKLQRGAKRHVVELGKWTEAK